MKLYTFGFIHELKHVMSWYVLYVPLSKCYVCHTCHISYLNLEILELKDMTILIDYSYTD